MVANDMCSRTSYVQTVQGIFCLFKGLYPSYHWLKVGNGLTSSNWDIAQNVILQWKWP